MKSQIILVLKHVSQSILAIEKCKVILYSAPCSPAKTHRKMQNKDLTGWDNPFLHQSWQFVLFHPSAVCFFRYLFKTLCMSPQNTWPRNMIWAIRDTAFSLWLTKNQSKMRLAEINIQTPERKVNFTLFATFI